MELHGMCSNILHKLTPIDNDNTAVQITSSGAELERQVIAIFDACHECFFAGSASPFL